MAEEIEQSERTRLKRLPKRGNFDRDTINSILDDHEFAERLAYSGSDRAKAFSWRGAAEKVWQLHADL